MMEIRIGISGWTYPPWRGDFYPAELLREHQIGMVVADTAGKWPLIEDVTADFIYIRLHGAEELYATGYTEPALDEWARKIRRWSEDGTPENAKLLTPPSTPSRSASASGWRHPHPVHQSPTPSQCDESEPFTGLSGLGFL